MTEEKRNFTTEEARQVLEQETQKNIEQCWKEIGKIITKYNLQFDVATVLQSNSISHQINLIPAPPQQSS